MSRVLREHRKGSTSSCPDKLGKYCKEEAGETSGRGWQQEPRMPCLVGWKTECIVGPDGVEGKPRAKW